MEGQLYEYGFGFHLIDKSATYYAVGVEYGSFKSNFISKDDIHSNYKLLQFDAENIKNIFKMYDIKGIDAKQVSEQLVELKYRGNTYYLKSWGDFYNSTK
jgi:hypothetical protein